MQLKWTIQNKATLIMDSKIEIEEVDYIPDIKDPALDSRGLRFEGTVLYIHLHNLPEVLSTHNDIISVKIHLTYFYAVAKIAKSLGGEVHSFDGGRMLVFFQGNTKGSVSSAVKAAMQIKYILASQNSKVNTYLSGYIPVDFGIGLDDGKILCVKVAVEGEPRLSKLLWLGESVNKAIAIGQISERPYHIGITDFIYQNLTDDVRFHICTNLQGREEEIDMWKMGILDYHDLEETFYYTDYQLTLP